jgi:hypothetical protein
VKGEKERVFAYTFHTACDRNGFVLAAQVTPGNVHDSQVHGETVKKAKLTMEVQGIKNLNYPKAV